MEQLWAGRDEDSPCDVIWATRLMDEGPEDLIDYEQVLGLLASLSLRPHLPTPVFGDGPKKAQLPAAALGDEDTKNNPKMEVGKNCPLVPTTAAAARGAPPRATMDDRYDAICALSERRHDRVAAVSPDARSREGHRAK